MFAAIEKAKISHDLSRDELIAILKSNEFDEALFKAADEARREFVGDEVHLRALIEFSNYCKNNCCYCGIRRDNRNATRYRLSADEIINLAKDAKAYGFKTVVMQSGEDEFYSVEKMQYILAEIKKLGLAITLSMGEKSFGEYQAYFEAGADRYLLRIETTDKDLYHRLDPGMSWDNRKRCLQDLKKIGYELGSGSMVGLPEQTIESIADDILFFKEIGVDMAGIGPFIPHQDTPLKNTEGKKFVLALKTMALTRILMPDINIPATTAMEALHPQGRIMALQSGANVVMPNVTETEYRKFYELYPGKVGVNDAPLNAYDMIAEKIKYIGRVVGQTEGMSLKYKREHND